MNATCERLIETLRRELLDRVLIPQPGAPSRRPDRVPGALQHGPPTPRHRPARPRLAPRHCSQPRRPANPPKIHPERPDQRVHPSRLTKRRGAGQQLNPIFGRDRLALRSPGRAAGERLHRQRGRRTPEIMAFGSATPGPVITLRRRPQQQVRTQLETPPNHLTQRGFDMRASPGFRGIVSTAPNRVICMPVRPAQRQAPC